MHACKAVVLELLVISQLAALRSSGLTGARPRHLVLELPVISQLAALQVHAKIIRPYGLAVLQVHACKAVVLELLVISVISH